MYYIVYKTTNLINGKVYIGAHKTSNLEDVYLGSGSIIKLAIAKYGKTNFKREILAVFDTAEEMFQVEAELVCSEFITKANNYNIKIGGSGGFDHIDNSGKVSVRDTDGTHIQVAVSDTRYVSGELRPSSVGRVSVKDCHGTTGCVSIDDPSYLSGELVPIATGTVVVVDKSGKRYAVSTEDHRYLSGELRSVALGNKSMSGQKHKETSKQKISDTHRRNKHQHGITNSQYGTCWIYNLTLKENKKIPKTELQTWLDSDWEKGRKMSF